MNAFRPFGIVDGKLDVNFIDLADFNDDKYDAIDIYADRNGNPLIVCASKSCNPARYRVIYNTQVCFFTRYKEVIDFCDKHDCRRIRKGGKH